MFSTMDCNNTQYVMKSSNTLTVQPSKETISREYDDKKIISLCDDRPCVTEPIQYEFKADKYPEKLSVYTSLKTKIKHNQSFGQKETRSRKGSLSRSKSPSENFMTATISSLKHGLNTNKNFSDTNVFCNKERKMIRDSSSKLIFDLFYRKKSTE